MDHDKVMLHGQAADAGGGGTRNGLHSEMLLLNLIILDDDF